MAEAVTLERRGDTAVITIDDGKANALSPDVITALNASLSEAQRSDSHAVVLCGRSGVFSGGFDLKVMRGGDFGAVGSLVTSGGELVQRVLAFDRPVVAACTGHAIAAGALLLLGSHFRVGGDGDFRIGLTETAIGMVLPDWAVVLAGERLSPTHVQQAIVDARVHSPAEARDAGFLDVVVPADRSLDVAVEHAERLGALDRNAYAGNAGKLRGPLLARLAEALAKDRAAITL